MAIMIIRCKIYFVFFIFVVCANHENIFTMKISRSTVYTVHGIATASFQAVDLHMYKQLQLTLRLCKHTRMTVLLLLSLTIAIVFPVHAQQQTIAIVFPVHAQQQTKFI